MVRPGLGVVCLPDNFAASVLKSKEQRGVIIKEVMPGSGAAEAGLRCGRCAFCDYFFNFACVAI